jgi:hypothetical protein
VKGLAPPEWFRGRLLVGRREGAVSRGRDPSVMLNSLRENLKVEQTSARADLRELRRQRSRLGRFRDGPRTDEDRAERARLERAIIATEAASEARAFLLRGPGQHPRRSGGRSLPAPSG